MNDNQRNLVCNNLKIIEWIIYRHIHTNKNIPELEYEDLYQVGCVALCDAAVSYNASTEFKTYAQVVIYNRLIDHCRQSSRRQSKLCYLGDSVPDSDNKSYEDILHKDEDSSDTQFAIDAILLLNKTKQNYKGVALKGIEAMELKIKGYSGIEIAKLFGVKSNNVGAWISRARDKLKKDEAFMAAFK